MEELLVAVHSFLDRLGVDEVRQRGAQDDKPLRMVKTLVHELCKALVGAAAGPSFHSHPSSLCIWPDLHPALPSHAQASSSICVVHQLALQKLGYCKSTTDGKSQPSRFVVGHLSKTWISVPLGMLYEYESEPCVLMHVSRAVSRSAPLGPGMVGRLASQAIGCIC